jgi:arylsulfatase A-like enzyme
VVINNVLFLYMDDMHVDDLETQMPYLWAEPYGNWIKFPNAVQDTPLCGPSRGHLILGQRQFETGVNDHGTMPGSLEAYYGDTLFDDVQAAGGYTGVIGKWINLWSTSSTYPTGIDYGVLRNSSGGTADNYNNVSYKRQSGSTGTASGYFTDFIGTEALAFVDAAVTAVQPWCLYLPVGASHNPFDPATRHVGVDVGRRIPNHFGWPGGDLPNAPLLYTEEGLRLSVAQIKTMMDNQADKARCMLAVDEMIQTVIEDLNTRGILDETVIIVSNDNGTGIGHHGWRTNNKRMPFRWVTNACTRIRWPGVAARRESRLVGHLDLAATIHAVMGTTPTLTPHGRDLTTLITTGADAGWRKSIAMHYLYPAVESGGASSRSWFAVRAGRWCYTEWYGIQNTFAGMVDANITDVTLYDLNADPFELRNLAGTETGIAAQCKLLLEEHKADPLYGGGFEDLP